MDGTAEGHSIMIPFGIINSLSLLFKAEVGEDTTQKEFVANNHAFQTYKH